MKLNLFFLLFAIMVSGPLLAQFPNNSVVYIYQYSYTDNDGIKTSEDYDPTIYFINIQNNVVGRTWDSKSSVKETLLDDADYYDRQAIQDVSSSYSQLKGTGSPSTVYAEKSIYCFDNRYSSQKKYTYRRYYTYAVYRKGGTGWRGVPLPPVLVWAEWSYGSECITFSSDRSEMILWSIDDPGYRTYYKRINKSDLKTNLDFLY